MSHEVNLLNHLEVMDKETTKMTEEEKEKWDNVQYRMDAEGFHYCFEGYSNFEEIKDEKFHKLRNSYLEAAKKLEGYITKTCEEAGIEKLDC